MNDLVIYHNPRCSKSRQTLEIIKDKGLTPTIKLYLETPPTAEELKHILNLLDLAPHSLMRIKETLYKENKLDNKALSDEQLIEAMIKFPKLIERPIVVCNNQAVIGRPPENVLDII